MRQASEPSVEEILESIKKVIARDNRAEAARERNRRDAAPESTPALAPAPAQSTRVSARSTVRGEGRPASFPADVLDLSVVAAQILNEDRGASVDAEEDEDAPLIAEQATASMRDSLAALAMLSAPGASPQIVRSGETSLESLVREMLRPALAEWLDKNLPPMVEKLVAAEIARIVGKKG
jgi:cell pole-organizing protein PopZ